MDGSTVDPVVFVDVAGGPHREPVPGPFDARVGGLVSCVALPHHHRVFVTAGDLGGVVAGWSCSKEAEQCVDVGVAAEGVETMTQLEFLRACNCDLAQGFLISRPMQPDKVATVLRGEIAGTGLLARGMP